MSVLDLARAKIAELDNRLSHGTVPSGVPWDSGRRTRPDGPNGTDGAGGTFGTIDPETRPSAPPCSPTIAESAPLISEGEGCDHATADARAPFEHGATTQWSAVADIHRERILARLDALPPASNDDGRRLLGLTRSFLDTENWQTAVALGWSLIELFGIDPHAPLTCLDGQGLVARLALARSNGCCLENIADDHAVIRCRSGSPLTYRRGAVGFDDAVLWWECPALIVSPEHAQ